MSELFQHTDIFVELFDGLALSRVIHLDSEFHVGPGLGFAAFLMPHFTGIALSEGSYRPDKISREFQIHWINHQVESYKLNSGNWKHVHFCGYGEQRGMKYVLFILFLSPYRYNMYSWRRKYIPGFRGMALVDILAWCKGTACGYGLRPSSTGWLTGGWPRMRCFGVKLILRQIEI